MSKERLEEFSRLPFIKRIELTKKSIQKDLEEHDYHFPKNVNINTQYVLEIIEQAERVQELEESEREWVLYQTKVYEIIHDLEQQNKRHREVIDELIDSWKDNVKTTKQHNESDYSNYRIGLIEGLEFAIDELENVLEGEE